ncbi:DUF3786 domain-containing protein [Chloroflexota bacterium]
MEQKPFSLPPQRNYEYAYTQAYKLARQQLAGIKDLKEQCRKSGAQYQEQGSRQVLSLTVLNQPYQVTLPGVEVTLAGSTAAVPLKTKILLLHYLIRAGGKMPSGKMITFKELPEGPVYFPTFAKRTLNPLLKYFGKETNRLWDTAEVLGGQKADYGDVAVMVRAFPKVVVTLVLWRGDSEFQPSASILFDASIEDYLPTEDIIRTCEAVIWRLVKSLPAS